jgi:extracellular elastinolytic metalloproteinase
MSREIDRRNLTPRRAMANRDAELRSVASAVSDRLPGAHRIRISRFDAATGNPAAVVSEAAPAEAGNYVQRALEHVRGISRALGLTATQPAEFVADPDYQTTSGGAVAVHLQQAYKGIPIFQAAEAVRFEPNGAIKETVGSTITVPEDVAVAPKLRVEEAVLRAARHVASPQEDEQGHKDPFGESLDLPSVNLEGFEPRVIAAFPEKPEKLTVLDAGPFGDKIKASLLWFPLGDALRLTWEVILTMPGYRGQYRTLVDAENGEIQYCRQLIETVAARGNVYRVHGGQARQMTDFPRPLADYGLPVPGALPAGFPDTWVETDRTAGNNVFGRLGANGISIQGALQSGVVAFDPANATGDDQKVLNIFYFNCFMHDFFYLLGFRESDGNFQQNNLGRGGSALDRVDARAHPGPVYGTANMGTPIDGLSPVMNMGLVSSTNRHTAFDSSVVFHEFTHGVTNRLVGGPANDRALDAPQSSGMGEGWSDYIACTINNTQIVGDWVVNDPAGIREFPYDSNFPDHFGKLGTGRYNEEHNIGEIWCATLMEMNRNIGANLGVQLVVDALKLTPANPSFLDARDAILAALDALRQANKLTQAEFDTARTGVWGAFAKFGMGPGARSNGAELSGIVADFTVPAGPGHAPLPSSVKVEATPNLKIPDNQPVGVNDVLAIPQAGRIKRLTVSVDIQHTFIGDLRVTLTSPSGKSVVLHNRNGGNQHDLIATYRSEDVLGLANLLGDQAQGNWTLHIADLAGVDAGKLRRWSLEFDLETSTQTIQKEASPAVTIPDNNPTGVSSSIAIAQSGAVRGIKVSVDITHSWIGDLRVELIAPSGQSAILHDQSGHDEDNLIRNYDSVTSPALAALAGQAVQGNWVLRVKDLAAQDIGKLNKWSLELTF